MTKFFIISALDSRSGKWEVWETLNDVMDLEEVVESLISPTSTEQLATFRKHSKDVDEVVEFANKSNEKYYKTKTESDVF